MDHTLDLAVYNLFFSILTYENEDLKEEQKNSTKNNENNEIKEEEKDIVKTESEEM